MLLVSESHTLRSSHDFQSGFVSYSQTLLQSTIKIGLHHNVGNISVLNMKASQWISHKHVFAPGFAAHVQTLGKIYAGELNLS